MTPTDEMWALARQHVRLFEKANRPIEEWIAEMAPSVIGKQALAYHLKRDAQHKNALTTLKLKHLCNFDQTLYDMLITGARIELADEARAKVP